MRDLAETSGNVHRGSLGRQLSVFRTIFRTITGRFLDVLRSRCVTPAAVEEGQARAVGDLPGLLQDCPLLVARVHQAVVDCLSQRLDGGVRPGLAALRAAPRGPGGTGSRARRRSSPRCPDRAGRPGSHGLRTWTCRGPARPRLPWCPPGRPAAASAPPSPRAARRGPPGCRTGALPGAASLRSRAAASLARISLTPGAAAPGACSPGTRSREHDPGARDQVRGGQDTAGALAGVHDALAVGELVRRARRAGRCARGR